MRVDKRSLHNWASGGPMNAANQERIQRITAVIDFIDRGSVDQTKRALLGSTSDGRIVLDWLAEGRDEDVKRMLGRGPGPREEGSHLVPEERIRRRPPAPATQLDARHDVAHVEAGTPRVVGRIRGPA